ncbi:succinate dehydrogenase, hydrophobic membrane anchor protein [Maritimibacter sp. 55A14]|uniref:succinate dehydrogenase, hydrophobic membrane anchor protein n=1 Tax=Maritimibacter sp. 55A14 TaxID=2174844 RepID=UPI000D6084B4|nr:succinate dehydrogenase, hydrophobic membrane anchor protein [Maritimibacter sp. 55A14]PWE29262.1 succinate dehydrogenase, hydrophobic membrane anchor protein [Maritimibacter sp. 55A14]
MSIKTDYKRVAGLGSAKDGTHHWWTQRLSSIALIPLTLLFVFTFGAHLGEGYEAVRAAYANPWNAVVAILFLIVGFHHLMQGLQVVIEDYVHGKAGVVLLILNTLLCWGFAIAGVFAVAKIAFGA